MEEARVGSLPHDSSAKEAEETDLADVATQETSFEESNLEDSCSEGHSGNGSGENDEQSLCTMPMTVSAEADVIMFNQERKASIDAAIDGLNAKITELEIGLSEDCLPDAHLLACGDGNPSAAGSEGAAARGEAVEVFDMAAADSVEERDIELSYAELGSPWCNGTKTRPGSPSKRMRRSVESERPPVASLWSDVRQRLFEVPVCESQGRREEFNSRLERCSNTIKCIFNEACAGDSTGRSPFEKRGESKVHTTIHVRSRSTPGRRAKPRPCREMRPKVAAFNNAVLTDGVEAAVQPSAGKSRTQSVPNRKHRPRSSGAEELEQKLLRRLSVIEAGGRGSWDDASPSTPLVEPRVHPSLCSEELARKLNKRLDAMQEL
jgi:hypothetical protein